MNLEDEIRDSLLNAVARPGGLIGHLPIKYESEILVMMTHRGYIGPAGCLTKKGARLARRIQTEEWEV